MHKSLEHIIKKLSRVRVIIIAALLFFCTVAIISFIHTTRLLWSKGQLHMRRGNAQGLTPAGPLAPENIQQWMTFDYINIVFRLPSDYIRSKLNLTDPSYPRVSIGRYAKRNGLKNEELLKNVRDAVSARVGY